MPDLRVVRKLGSGKIHVVRMLSVSDFNIYSFLSSPFIGVPLPTIVECGVELRGKNDAAVCMEPGTKVTCAPCRRLSGIERAPDDNHLLGGKTGTELWEMVQKENERKEASGD